MRKILIISILLILSPNLWTQEKVVTAAISSIPPYIDPEDPDGGILVALNRAAWKAVGYTLVLRTVPANRVYLETKDGLVDTFLMGSARSDSPDFLFSEGIMETQMVAAILPGTPLSSTRSSDLKGLKWGTVRGFGIDRSYPDLEFDLSTDGLSNLRKLLLKRVDGIMEDRLSLLRLLKKEGSPEAKSVRILTPPLQTFMIATGFSLKTSGAEEKRQAFNRGLRLIRNSGEWERILVAHENRE